MAAKVRKGKTLDCKICGEEVKNVGEDTVKVTCWKCVNKMMSGELNVCVEPGEIDSVDDHEEF